MDILANNKRALQGDVIFYQCKFTPTIPIRLNLTCSTELTIYWCLLQNPWRCFCRSRELSPAKLQRQTGQKLRNNCWKTQLRDNGKQYRVFFRLCWVFQISFCTRAKDEMHVGYYDSEGSCNLLRSAFELRIALTIYQYCLAKFSISVHIQ